MGLQGNDIQGCSLCIQYRLPLKSLGNVLHRSWKMGAKRDPNRIAKTFLLHFNEDQGFFQTLRSKYNVPLQEIPIPSEKENKKALTKRSVQVIRKTNTQLAE